jgi:putative ABC transport system ATP-binding protein
MLSVRDIRYKYSEGEVMHFPDFECLQGDQFLLLGQSGSGKTTLLQLLAGLRSPMSGEIKIGDININQLSISEMDRFRGQNIGLVFQSSHFISALTVGENIAIAQSLAGNKVDNIKIKTLLSRLNIGQKINKKTYNLSQGEQQRVAIARAIINDPKVILADEPTSALDDVNTEEVLQLLMHQAKEVNSTLIIVTHDNRLKERFNKRIIL